MPLVFLGGRNGALADEADWPLDDLVEDVLETLLAPLGRVLALNTELAFLLG